MFKGEMTTVLRVGGWMLIYGTVQNTRDEYKHTSNPTACVLMIPLYQGWWKHVFKISSAVFPEVWENHNVFFDEWRAFELISSESLRALRKELMEQLFISNSLLLCTSYNVKEVCNPRLYFYLNNLSIWVRQSVSLFCCACPYRITNTVLAFPAVSYKGWRRNQSLSKIKAHRAFIRLLFGFHNFKLAS